MPHIASQMSDRTPPGPNRRATAPLLQRSPEFHDFQRPVRGRQHHISSADDAPSLSFLVTNHENKHWDIGSIRHIRNPSSASQNITPDSAVDSIFHHSPGLVESPNTPSSPVRSPFVAELEDTSSMPVLKTRIPKDPVVTQLESYIEKLQRPEFTVRLTYLYLPVSPRFAF